MHCTNKQTVELNRQQTLQKITNFMTDALIKAGRLETSQHALATSPDSIPPRSQRHLFSLQHSDFMYKNCSLQHSPLYSYLRTILLRDDYYQEECTTRPNFEGSQSRIYIANSQIYSCINILWPISNINFRSKFSFFNESEQRIKSTK